MTDLRTPGRGDLSIYAGDTFTAQLTFQTPTGAPMTLPDTGWTAMVRYQRDSTDGHPITVDTTQAGDGILTLSMPAEVTASIITPTGVWDIQHTDGTTVTTWVTGKVTIIKDVTR
ncbi:DUF7264 domain-containing protein [Microbacterium esteraromaticum]|uniref:LtfC-like domain-containing protein n=1 Tax=Microbacterium esteraromaticum TaxID=57043 RepID=UPI001C715381|nr:hypothetical protein [Microbacterium esteraromaticum]